MSVLQRILCLLGRHAWNQIVEETQHKFKATCCKCGKVDWLDEPAKGVYFCGYGCT